MENYVILTDTGCDLEKELRDKYGIEYVCMRYVHNGTDYEASLDWEPISAPEFYQMMRDGERFYTAQVNVETYKTAFEKYASEGRDVLYVGCSSGLSASIQSAKTAREEVLAAHPERKIICIDTLRACYALGILVITAAEMRAEGKTIDETAEWLEKNKLTANMEGTVDNLKYLRQAGRVSAASAFFAGLLNIKPIIMADALGRNFAVEKIKGRKAAFARLAERVKERFTDVPHQKLFISHADCLEEAEELKAAVLKALGKDIPVHIGYVGCCVGASVGPGMISVDFFGKEVTLNKGE